MSIPGSSGYGNSGAASEVEDSESGSASVEVNGEVDGLSVALWKVGTKPRPRRPLKVVLFKKYELRERIENGSFGIVYLLGKDLTSEQLLMVKLEDRFKRNSMVSYEHAVMTRLASSTNCQVLKPLNLFVSSDYFVLVMPFVGPTLQTLSDRYSNRTLSMSYPTVWFLARQMVRCLSYVHEQGFIHQNITPSNFVIDPDNKVWLVNFEVSKPFGTVDRAKIYTKEKENGMKNTPDDDMTGTSRFASANAMRGNPQTFQDDLISLGYVILYLLKRDLPWIEYGGGLARTCADMKTKFEPCDLRTCPKVSHDAKLTLVKYFQLVNSKEGGDLPWIKYYDYQHYKKLGKIFEICAAGSVDLNDVKHLFEWEM